jgi:beta-fructofuranosidase
MVDATSRAQAIRRRLAADPHRPGYHFLPPSNWMNDPNGLIQWRGQYHLFYQYNPREPFHDAIHWGHAVSDDLVHWHDLPIALTPTEAGPDKDGCWSGSAVDADGTPMLFYTGVHPQTVLAAKGSDDLLVWEKLAENPLIAGPPPSIDAGAPPDFRDPFVWREGDVWYLAIASRIAGRGGTVLLYRSSDLLNWEYLRPLLIGDQRRQTPFWTATGWECPNFLAIDGRHALIVSFQDQAPGHLLYTGYFVGTYDNHHFRPYAEGILEYGGYAYAPQVLKEDGGRYLLWTSLLEGRSREAQRASGWAGVMSLPRMLYLSPDGRLAQRPAPELQSLRRAHWSVADIEVGPGEDGTLAGVYGDALEIAAVFEPAVASNEAGRFGITVRRSPDGEEATRIVYDRSQQHLSVDRSRSSSDPEAHRDVPETRGAVASMPLALEAAEPLQLRVFLDRSVLEIFVNGRYCLSTRIYPARSDSLEVQLFAENGPVRLTAIDIWQMASIW